MKGHCYLIISERIQKMKPPLTEAERKLLYNALDEDGVRDPLVVWRERRILIDGYYRYVYCCERGIPFEYIEMDFADETEAMLWVARNQIARRNLTPFQKCEMVLPLEAGIAAEAKKWQGRRSDIYGKRVGDSIDTRKILANMAGVSTGTLSYVKYIIENGDQEMLRRVRSGELSIYGAYRSLVQRLEPPNKTEKTHMTIENAKAKLEPIRTAMEELIDRVRVGEASPKAIIVELSRVAEMIDDANGAD